MNAAIMFGNHSNYPTSPSVASTYSDSSSSSSELSQNSTYSSISLSYLSPNSHHSSSQENAMGTPRKSSSVQDFYLQKNSSSTWPNQTTSSSKSSPTGALMLTGRSRHSRSGKSKRRQHDHQHQFHQRHAANLRERKRMQSINDAFEGLRERIPTLPYEKRLSKVDTLRLAIGYISFLGELVRTGGSSLQLNGGTFPGRYCPIPPPIKKVVLKSQQTGPNGDELEQHSLSWESDENKRPGVVQHGNVLIAKVWTPEDPRGPNQPNLDNNFDKAQQQQQTIAQSTSQKTT